MAKVRPSLSLEKLRRKAEALLNGASRETPITDVQDFLEPLHEIEAQRIELELQNNELRQAVRKLEDAQSDFTALYEFSPVAVLSVNSEGIIERCNKAASLLFNRTRDRIVGLEFSHLIIPADHRIYYDFLKRTVLQEADAFCELRIANPEKHPLIVQLYARVVSKQKDETLWQFALLDITEARNREKQLKYSETLYRTIAANLPNGAAFIVDRKLTYVLAEGQALELAGMKPGDLEGKALHEALDPELATLYEPHYRSALNGTASKIEHHGHDRYFLTHFTPLHDNDGTVYAALAVSYDITDRGHAEKALRRSEQNLADELSTAHLLHKVSTQLLQANGVQALYAKILDTAVDLMHADFGSIQVFYPDRGKEGELRLIGYRGFNEPSARFWEWVRPASESTCGVALRTRQRVLVPDVQACGFMAGSEDLKAYLQNGIRAVQTTPLLSRTGTLIGMLSTHWRQPHTPTEGQLRAIDVLARQAADLIDQKKADEALKESEERFRTMADGLPLIVWVHDAEGKQEFVNQTFLDFFGVAHDEMKDNRWQVLMHPEDAPGYADEFLACVRERRFFHRRVRVQNADGEWRWIESWGRPRITSSGKYLGHVGTSADITERKRAEEALHESVQELNEYTYALTHNIKAPFRAVQNYATFLLEDLADALDDKPKQFLDGIKKAVRLANQQFEDLEALYSVKDRPLEFETFDMRQLLGEIAALHDGMRDRDLVIEAQWPTLWGERFLLRQILMALVNNGLKYNASEIKRVEVTWRHGADRRFEIIVRDNGIGIDPRYHEQIFRIFQRLHTEQEYEGTGIGLAVVRKAVKRLDGKVRIESTAGKGSTFVISLPATMAEAASGHDP